MRSNIARDITLLYTAILLPSLVASINLNCESIVVDKTHFNLKALGGVHAVSTITEHPPTKINTTFELNICTQLKPHAGQPKDEHCPGGTYVCGTQYKLDADGVPDEKPYGVIPIAGQYTTTIGGDIDVKYTRLKTSASHADSQNEGLRMELHGPKYTGKKQKAIIEFLCLRDSDGETEKRQDDGGASEERPTPSSREEIDDGQGGKLKFLSYMDEEDEGVLRMRWDTKYACEDADAPERSGGWGFFSWFFFILFLSLIAYMSFGAWLNHNRYGARGWDLLPHGDTIRDIPYIMQDWFRKVIDTVQGGHTRGGYSAV